ncbi:MAG: tRNA pseudouridine(55) synthase TruB [Candidatus Omnitrophota bacterium]
MVKINDDLAGIILVNKPSGITSHDVVDVARCCLKMKKVGHAGTLDPLAQGLLILLVGRYTKFFPRFAAFDKEYIGMIKLGEVTTTGDSEGKILEKKDFSSIDRNKIKDSLSNFIGETDQIPPMVSALRVDGKRLYKLARRGIVVKRRARRITIYELKILKVDVPFVEFYVKCSKGTYIRKLAEDIGENLGCGAHIVKIQRLNIGPFKLSDAVELDKISAEYLREFNISSGPPPAK